MLIIADKISADIWEIIGYNAEHKSHTYNAPVFIETKVFDNHRLQISTPPMYTPTIINSHQLFSMNNGHWCSF